MDEFLIPLPKLFHLTLSAYTPYLVNEWPIVNISMLSVTRPSVDKV